MKVTVVIRRREPIFKKMMEG